ncbi:MAG: AAA family ATPase [Kofleriaceae bacterium]
MNLPEIPPGGAVDWPALAALLAEIVPADQLAATPQDAGYHAEGDVWIHTRMAVEALVGGSCYAALDRIGRAIVLAGVLLHDVGKPSTTRLDGDKLTSRGHSARGDNLVRVALWRLGVPFGVREHVCALVRHHQIPFFGITKPAADAQHLAIRLSLVTRHDWLVAVADADARGRRCTDPADQARIIDHCALWAEHCRELGVLDRAFAFPSPHTARVWHEAAPGARQPEVPAHDDTVAEAILMSGLPASGKDTWLRERPALPVISLDDLRTELDIDPADDQAHVIAAAREQARGYLRAGTSFAWNASNLSPPLRSQLLELFRNYRARTRIVYVETTAFEQHARNQARVERVPTAVIIRMLDRWTVPLPGEAHEVTYQVPAAAHDPVWPPVNG